MKHCREFDSANLFGMIKVTNFWLSILLFKKNNIKHGQLVWNLSYVLHGN